ncbi:non-homologous end-joining factor 1-like [Ochlerotatus camptorhynchus]|uniref:non-homologous end-joining factor 1-like n=1 Tax=Ochlerotatus camptorhynchus TaxID=644619 RepID=UPI0031D1E841
MLEFLKINDKHYIVQIRKVDDQPVDKRGDCCTTVQCNLFDLARLWCETISVEDLIEREKKSDAIIQYTPEIVNETILARKADDFSISQGCEDSICGDLFLRLKYYVQSYPVTFTLRLKVASTEELAENVLLPTWRTLLLLYEENCSLKDIIIKKDIEIEQYKVEGAVLKRSLVATNKFDECKFAENFPLSAAEEGLRIRELIKSKDRRGNLMKQLKIKSKDPSTESGSPIKNATVGKAVLTPTRKSPGGRAKGLDAIYAKQRIPKPISVSSLSLKRLQVDQGDEEDKEGILDESQTSINKSDLSNTSGMVKVRKITKL